MLNKTRSMILISHAVVWALAILFVSYMFKEKSWSGDIAPWMAVAFIFANGLLLSLTNSRRY